MDDAQRNPIVTAITRLFRVAKRAVRAVSRALVRSLARPGTFLLVRRAGDSAKLDRIADRLRFAKGGAVPAGNVVEVARPSLLQVIRSAVVVEVDEGLVPRWMHNAFEHVYRLDFERDFHDGWELLRIATALAPSLLPKQREEIRARFDRRIAELKSKGRRVAYLLGTGPSLEGAMARDFRDGYVVVCNTIVRDAVLWEHLAPDFIAAGDAIYHFGFTEHARAFRADLRQRLLSHRGRTFFVYPDIFDVVVRREMGDLEELLVPIPFGDHDDVAVDLTSRFELPMIGNVLNCLLLPLGCTLSRSTHLWGFDGRAPDDKLFWSNSAKHAYPELMPSLVEEHPAFYDMLVPKGCETSYVKAVHGDELDRRLRRAEARGFEFVMMHKTWTETLSRRIVGVPPE